MSVFTISTLNAEPEIRENLFNELKFLCKEEIKLNLSKKTAGKFLLLDCSVDENEDNQSFRENLFRQYLANVITDLLTNQLTKILISRILKNKYNYLDEVDAETITQNAYTYLTQAQDSGDFGLSSRQKKVFSEVSQYLDQNSNLYLEGFLRFRLKDYFQEVVNAIEKAVDNFLLEKEYREFIQLLRYFVDIQEPKIDEVHVLIQSKQEIYFLDEVNQPVKPEQIRSVLTEFDQDIDYEDWLLSALITIAPHRIILHIASESEMAQTICSVFQSRVFICDGCPLCKKPTSLVSLVEPKTKPH